MTTKCPSEFMGEKEKLRTGKTVPNFSFFNKQNNSSISEKLYNNLIIYN